MRDVLRELDARALPPARRHTEILGAFESLGPEEAFVLITDHDPKPLLYQFQAERPAAFGWSVLEAGPERYRVEVRRRSPARPWSVSEFLEGDHRRLDAIMAGVAARVGAGSYAEAARGFAEFACGLNRHIEMEEQVLFPAFEKATGETRGPTAVMRAEHVEIRRLLDVIASAIHAGDRGAFAAASAELRVVLGSHNVKEESVLYPTVDAIAGTDRERHELVSRMQTL